MTSGTVRAAKVRGISTSSRQMVLLAPSLSATSDFFADVTMCRDRHEDLIEELQELRGRIYLEEGPITEDELINDRHQQPSDDRSWHLLILDKNRVCGCARYLEHSNRVS